MPQSTLLFNALKQEKYQHAKSRLLNRTSFAALHDALLTHYHYSNTQTPVVGLLLVIKHRLDTTPSSSASTSQQQASLSPMTQATFLNPPSFYTEQAPHQHTVMLVINRHDEEAMGNFSHPMSTQHKHTTFTQNMFTQNNQPHDQHGAQTQYSTAIDIDTGADVHVWDMPLHTLEHPSETLALCYSPALSYGLLGFEADEPRDDPSFHTMVTLQLDHTLDVIRALVNVVELVAAHTSLADDLRYFLLETLLSIPPTLTEASDYTSYFQLVNKLGCFRSDTERLISLALAVADRLQAAKTSLSTLQTLLRDLASLPKRTVFANLELASLAIPLAGATPTASSGSTQTQHIMLAAVVATISDYLQHPKTGSEALLAMRQHVPRRYPLQVFQSLSQHERDVLTNATQATLSGIVEGEDLFSVLQMAQSLARDGTLVLEGLGVSNQRRGWVALRAGQAVGIETQHDVGLEALLEIILWGASQFSFYNVTSVTAQPLNKTSSELLMSIATYLDILERLNDLGFSAKAQWLRLRDGDPEQYTDVLRAATTTPTATPSFNALVAAGHARSRLLHALDHLTQTGWLEFSVLEPPSSPLRQFE
ncbi:MAG: DUF4388 domain-containing protein [Deinococcota bacterium]